MKDKLKILVSHCPGMDPLFIDDQRRNFRQSIFDAMEEYAEECVKASLEKASEKGCDSLELYNSEYDTLKKSITNPENIILL